MSGVRFDSPATLARAKADLYAALAAHGEPLDRARLRQVLPSDSPLRDAMDGWPRRDPRARTGGAAVTGLREIIYRSELHHGAADRFDETVPPRAGTPPARRNRRRLLVILPLLWVAATVALAVSDLARTRAAVEGPADAYRAALSGVAATLTAFYATCLDGARCGDGTGAANDLARALDATTRLLLAAGPAPARTYLATQSEGCGEGSVAADLCEVRARLVEHSLCVTRPEGVPLPRCREMARLAVIGTRFEDPDASGQPRPVNVFSQPLELSEELVRFAALAGPDLSRLRLRDVVETTAADLRADWNTVARMAGPVVQAVGTVSAWTAEQLRGLYSALKPAA